MRCKSPFCVVQDQVRGREFEPPKDAQGLASVWCPICVQLSAQIQYFSTETAQMIRGMYRAYTDTELPKEVKLILEQFARELIQMLGEEL